MSELKPCPFCGGEADTEIWWPFEWVVKCQGCRSETGRFLSKSAAIEAWNRRTPMPSLDERREVAARLREIEVDNYCRCEDYLDALEEAIGCRVGIDYGEPTYRLADLIEPEERTCRMEIDWDYDGDCPAYYRDYVCSECKEDFIYYKNSRVSFCPNCGAKVVKE